MTVLNSFFCSFSLIPAQTSAQKLTSGDDQKKRQEVWRRYSEFEALRNFLVAVYPHIVMPPLPEKAVCVYIPSLAFLHEYQYDVTSMVLKGVARILGRGVPSMRARKFWPRPHTKWKGRSSNHHRERVLNVASELESRFLTEFWDKFLAVF